VLVFNPVARISVVDDVAQVAVVSAMPSTALLWWSDVASRVPTGTTPMVTLVTPILALLVMNWICYDCCV
jgi:hypothetical protein